MELWGNVFQRYAVTLLHIIFRYSFWIAGTPGHLAVSPTRPTSSRLSGVPTETPARKGTPTWCDTISSEQIKSVHLRYALQIKSHSSARWNQINSNPVRKHVILLNFIVILRIFINYKRTIILLRELIVKLHCVFQIEHSYWQRYVQYSLPPPNCWSCLLFRGYHPATVFSTVEKWNNPRLLSIPSVTMNWRQTTILLWWWPVIIISDWFPFRVRYWINKRFSQKFCRSWVSVSCCCAGLLRESCHFANFIKLHIIFPNNCTPPP